MPFAEHSTIFTQMIVLSHMTFISVLQKMMGSHQASFAFCMRLTALNMCLNMCGWLAGMYLALCLMSGTLQILQLPDARVVFSCSSITEGHRLLHSDSAALPAPASNAAAAAASILMAPAAAAAAGAGEGAGGNMNQHRELVQHAGLLWTRRHLVLAAAAPLMKTRKYTI